MKKHKFKILTFVAVAAALAGTGCFKSIGYETFYVLRPWAQEGTVKTPIPREDMLAYAFDADTTEWSVLSYEDAVAGIITSRRTGEKLQPIAQGEPYEIDGNDMGQMVAALDLAAVTKNGKPKCIFGHTVKGKGVSFMENQCGWHGVAPNDQEYQQAMAELDRQYVKC